MRRCEESVQSYSHHQMTEPSSQRRPYYNVDPNMDRYIPNHIPAGERWTNVGLSILFLAWGAYGLWFDDLFIPSRRGGIHLHGSAALIMFLALVSAVLNLLIVIADHFDIRNNELTYRRAAFATQAVGWLLSVVAIGVEVSR